MVCTKLYVIPAVIVCITIVSLQWCIAHFTSFTLPGHLTPFPPPRSECAYYFSLSWLITWFGHVVESHDTVCRLVDLFLATHPLMPVYVSTAVSHLSLLLLSLPLLQTPPTRLYSRGSRKYCLWNVSSVQFMVFFHTFPMTSTLNP